MNAKLKLNLTDVVNTYTIYCAARAYWIGQWLNLLWKPKVNTGQIVNTGSQSTQAAMYVAI